MVNLKNILYFYNFNMRNFWGILLILGAILCSNICLGDNYGVYNSHNYRLRNDSGEKILFILDFSNSMNEYTEDEPKCVLMVRTVKQLLAKIPPETAIGMRVYGHRPGFTAKDMCKASKNVAPICPNNNRNIMNVLDTLHPNGMTPITYSLKQAIQNDFAGISGKKRIILLTDGGENCDESPCKFAMQLIKTRRDISIDVIAFTVDDEDDLAQLECASLVTSGRFYTADTAAQLAKSLEQSLNSSKKVEAVIIPQR